MSSPIPRDTLQFLRHFAFAAELDAGLDLAGFEARIPKLTRAQGGGLQGMVLDEQFTLYSTTIWADDLDLHSACDCEFDAQGMCRHAVALLVFEYLAKGQRSFLYESHHRIGPSKKYRSLESASSLLSAGKRKAKRTAAPTDPVSLCAALAAAGFGHFGDLPAEIGATFSWMNVSGHWRWYLRHDPRSIANWLYAAALPQHLVSVQTAARKELLDTLARSRHVEPVTEEELEKMGLPDVVHRFASALLPLASAAPPLAQRVALLMNVMPDDSRPAIFLTDVPAFFGTVLRTRIQIQITVPSTGEVLFDATDAGNAIVLTPDVLAVACLSLLDAIRNRRVVIGRLEASLLRDPWEYVHRIWDSVVAPRVEVPPEVRSFAYRVTKLDDGAAYASVDLVVSKERRSAKGKVSASWVLAKPEWVEVVLEAAHYPLDPVDREIIEWMMTPGNRGKGSGRITVDFGLIDVLEKLVGRPNVVDELGQRVMVRAAEVSLHVGRVSDGRARVAPRHGTYDLTRDDLRQLAQRAQPLRNRGRLASWDVASRILWVGRVPALVEDLARVDPRAFDPIAESSLQPILSRLPYVSERASVSVDPDLVQRRVIAETTPIVQMQRDAEGVQLRLVVKPAGGLIPWPPGEGPAQSFVSGDAGVEVLERDLDRERLEAGELEQGAGIARMSKLAESAWHTADVDVMFDVVERLRNRGAQIEWIDSNPPRMYRATAADTKVRISQGRDWFGLSGEVAISPTETVPLALLLDAIRNNRKTLVIDADRWMSLDDRLRKAFSTLARITDGGTTDRLSAVHAALLADISDEGADVTVPKAFETSRAAMQRASQWNPPVPANLESVLRPYQRDGFTWLARMSAWAPGACLADDMGLGKTVQALALLQQRAAGGPALVVAPTSLTFNWLREAAKFAPSLVIHRWVARQSPAPSTLAGAGSVIVISYDLLVMNAAGFQEIEWHSLVVDEAQAVKNATTQRAQTVGAIKADFKLALTGTPIENRTAELWSLFALIAPNYLGSLDKFTQRFTHPIERDRNPAASADLARMIRPFVLRRLKSEVAPELPPKIEKLIEVELSPAERTAYDRIRRAVLASFEEEAAAEAANPQTKRILLLAALTRMRQAACHARLVAPDAPAISAKEAALSDLLEQLVAEGRKVLVFSQFTSLLDLIEKSIHKLGIGFGRLDGSTPPVERQRLVDRFEAGGFDVFLLSLKAGGTGLNLVAADTVIHLDPWWNPAVEDQATDRAHRIGQTRTVHVIRLVARDTVEDGILQMHAQKRELVDAMLEGTDRAGAISTDEILTLIGAG